MSIQELKGYLSNPESFKRDFYGRNPFQQRKAERVLQAAVSKVFNEHDGLSLMQTVYRDSLAKGCPGSQEARDSEKAFVSKQSEEWPDHVHATLFKISRNWSPRSSPLPVLVMNNLKRSQRKAVIQQTSKLPGPLITVIAEYSPSFTSVIDTDHIRGRHDLVKAPTAARVLKTRIGANSVIALEQIEPNQRKKFTSYFPTQNIEIAKLFASSSVVHTSLKGDRQLLHYRPNVGNFYRIEAIHGISDFLKDWGLLPSRINNMGLVFIKTAYPVFCFIRHGETELLRGRPVAKKHCIEKGFSAVGEKAILNLVDRSLSKEISLQKKRRRGEPILKYMHGDRLIVDIAKNYFGLLDGPKGLFVDIAIEDIEANCTGFSKIELQRILLSDLDYKMPTKKLQKK